MTMVCALLFFMPAAMAIRAKSVLEALAEIDPVQCAQQSKQELRQFLHSQGIDVPVLCNRVKRGHEFNRLPGLHGFIHQWKNLPGMCLAYKSAFQGDILENAHTSDPQEVMEWAQKFNAELMTGEDAICLSDSNPKFYEDSSGRIGPFRLEGPSSIQLNIPSGERKWCDWKTAGWKPADLKLAQKQTVDEWKDAEFQMMLLKQSVKSDIKCCTWYNNQLQMFQTPSYAQEYLEQAKVEGLDPNRTAIFVLGPSAAGKTSIVASLHKLRKKMAYQFPAMTFDGADVREVSAVWKRYAQDGGKWEGSHKDGTRHWVPDEKDRGCLLNKYFEEIARPICRPRLKKLMLNWVEEYKPKTVLIPETAVPCFSAMFKKTCKIIKTIKKFRKLGYTVQFVVVYAPAEQVKEAGMRRALSEGKPYSSRGYAMALHSAEELYKRFGRDSEFIFVNNTYRKNQLPEEMSGEMFQQVVSKATRRQIQEMMPFGGRGHESKS